MRSTLGRMRPGQPAAAAAWIVLIAAGACAGGGEGIVYYQVTYANGTVRDLDEVPADRKGIARVLRISRIEGPQPGYSILSVDRDGTTVVETGRTMRAELRWNGKAWVGREPPAATRPAARPGHPRQEQTQAATAKVKAMLQADRDRLKVCDQAVMQAAEALTKAKGTDGEKAAMLLLSKAQRARQQRLRRIVRLEGLLSDLTGAAPQESVGAVVPAEPAAPETDALGIVKPIRRRRILPHRMQVWRLPRARGRRTYRVAMAHPEAGWSGAFHYVAYADTDGDGTPDTLIARSPPASADTPGRWTRWSFTTEAECVFVGNAWTCPHGVQYCEPHVRGNWRGLGTEVYVSGRVAGPPRHKWGRPYVSNIRVGLVRGRRRRTPAGRD